MPSYSFLDRMLHRAALQVVPIAELSFDLDQKSIDKKARDVTNEKHVFVSGLARAGTTILMRRFYATGQYCSLTYRNMPFILAPNLWAKLSGLSAKTIEASERAHGDRILVDVDSPESFDEVFWRIFDGGNYIGKTFLAPHTPDADVIGQFRSYVAAILASDGRPDARYLSKNNNNILRLKAIRQAFPNAVILIPFRNPISHAASLLRQDQNFIEEQEKDSFVRSYMTWLGHHEFGQDHRPFRMMADGAERLKALSRDRIGYWLELWCQTYGWLEEHAPEDAIFVCYEDLCQNPDVWSRLAALSDAGSPDDESNEAFVISDKRGEADAFPELVDRASAIYDRLAGRARRALGL
ncbi:hypothetical protein HDIA_3307 [Hartmannibacter diazotrophicus]|uniref:Sulfotransferase domain protein n=1 Tax=Hartmannibacter diazotrophicus TaxID=1482074 RepID=A0A2C9D9N0_9HYPH|nr:sulfotransferase [Hartmannibacter diazotrophicus]SON56848.1 hypothetical protein HDIA_3307 [Hartmannibacter diazotrophicus]